MLLISHLWLKWNREKNSGRIFYTSQRLIFDVSCFFSLFPFISNSEMIKKKWSDLLCIWCIRGKQMCINFDNFEDAKFDFFFFCVNAILMNFFFIQRYSRVTFFNTTRFCKKVPIVCFRQLYSTIHKNKKIWMNLKTVILK